MIKMAAFGESDGSDGLAGCVLNRSCQCGLNLLQTLSEAGNVGGLLAILQPSAGIPCYDGNLTL